jgi:hypothetical protein
MLIEGTEEYKTWLQQRVGKCTASRIRDVVATIKSGGYGASRERYRGELIVERQTGQPYPAYVNQQMRWGNDTQPHAEAAYVLFTGNEVKPAEECYPHAFVPHPHIEMAGASPDGFTQDGGLVEFKCPDTHTHINTLRTGTVPVEYYDQMQFQMSCADRRWCDWVSFDPRMPADRQLFVRRIIRDDARIAELEREASLFLREVAAECAALTKLTPNYLLYNMPVYMKERVG